MLDTLLKVLPAPASPLETGHDDNWGRVEQALRIALPQDYKDYISTYGTGYLGGFIWGYNPFSEISSLRR